MILVCCIPPFLSVWRPRYFVRILIEVQTGVGAGCQSNDGTKSPRFTPIFPGTCPYITAVGGTQAVAPEVAWVASSGGFSDYFPRPWYQEAAIGTYLSAFIAPETIDYYSKFANFSGRGFPDISAHSLTPE